MNLNKAVALARERGRERLKRKGTIQESVTDENLEVSLWRVEEDSRTTAVHLASVTERMAKPCGEMGNVESV